MLEDPYRAVVSLKNDVKCLVAFPEPSYEIRGDIDTLLIPVQRTGPKGRPVTVNYATQGRRMLISQHLRRNVGMSNGDDLSVSEILK